MRIFQYRSGSGARGVALVEADGDRAKELVGISSVYELANHAVTKKQPLAKLIEEAATGRRIDYAGLLASGDVLTPLDHPEPARFFVTGTGLSHIGSAAARNKMHIMTHGSDAPESDSMKIFRMGVEGGKPSKGKIGVVPEWFYKGTGECVVAPGETLPLPGFAITGAEEPEIVGLYIVDANRNPRRIGFAIGNEYSDHTIEAKNYLYTGLSKLRACSFGPELMIGDPPADLRGKSRIIRQGKVLWEDEALLGEANMSHSFANLEHHHFKYPIFRRPGDLHAHYFGAAVLSFAAGVKTQSGDEFEIEVPAFGKPLRNPMRAVEDEGLVTVTPL